MFTGSYYYSQQVIALLCKAEHPDGQTDNVRAAYNIQPYLAAI